MVKKKILKIKNNNLYNMLMLIIYMVMLWVKNYLLVNLNFMIKKSMNNLFLIMMKIQIKDIFLNVI